MTGRDWGRACESAAFYVVLLGFVVLAVGGYARAERERELVALVRSLTGSLVEASDGYTTCNEWLAYCSSRLKACEP